MDNALKELIRISNTVGKDPSLVQGGGGNTSVKTDDAQDMYIKASGTALKDMTARHCRRSPNPSPHVPIYRETQFQAKYV